MDINEVLNSKFGLQSFRGEQEGVIQKILAGESVLTVMPTGTGKSLCYQLPSFIFEGLTLVISPLISLMKDQVDAANKVGLRAGCINSSMTAADRAVAYKKLKNQKFELLLVTPERFLKSEFIEVLQENKVSLLAVDEAHCISQWGHDFRPEYSRLDEIKNEIGDPPVLALTATATPEVQKDIAKLLGISQQNIIVSPIARPELVLNVDEVYGVDSKIQKIVLYRHHSPGPCIIYFSLVSTLQKVSCELKKLGLEHTTYHGQMNAKERKRQQNMFIYGKSDLILATPAFGLGIDKPDVRSVIHAELPGSIEAYYQEVGRAGRDGESSFCVVLYDNDDVSIHLDFIKWSTPDPGFISSVFHLIKDNQLRYQQEGPDYLREKLNFYNRKDFRVETSLRLLERWGCLLPSKSVRHEVISEPDPTYLDEKIYKNKLKTQNQKLLDVLQWAESKECRASSVHAYFSQSSRPCGVCDNCKGGI